LTAYSRQSKRNEFKWPNNEERSDRKSRGQKDTVGCGAIEMKPEAISKTQWLEFYEFWRSTPASSSQISGLPESDSVSYPIFGY